MVSFRCIAIELLVWPHEVEPWFCTETPPDYEPFSFSKYLQDHHCTLYFHMPPHKTRPHLQCLVRDDISLGKSFHC